MRIRCAGIRTVFCGRYNRQVVPADRRSAATCAGAPVLDVAPVLEYVLVPSAFITRVIVKPLTGTPFNKFFKLQQSSLLYGRRKQDKAIFIESDAIITSSHL